MTQDITTLSDDELAHTKELIEGALKNRKQSEIDELLTQLMKTAKAITATVANLFGTSALAIPAPPPAETVSTVKPKYGNPNDPSQTWSGRGKHPAWVTNLLATGLTKDDLLLEKNT